MTDYITNHEQCTCDECRTGRISDWRMRAEYSMDRDGLPVKLYRDRWDAWIAQHDLEVVARTLAAQSTGGVCQIKDPDLEWEGWVEEATELIKGEEQ